MDSVDCHQRRIDQPKLIKNLERSLTPGGDGGFDLLPGFVQVDLHSLVELISKNSQLAKRLIGYGRGRMRNETARYQ